MPCVSTAQLQFVAKTAASVAGSQASSGLAAAKAKASMRLLSEKSPLASALPDSLSQAGAGGQPERAEQIQVLFPQFC